VNSGTNLKVEILIDASLYSMEATLRAAHRFTATNYVEVTPRPDGALVVATPRQDGTLSPTFREEFMTALLDEALRERIARETHGVRDLLVRIAFGRSLPRDGEAETRE